jgi:hypothetical protein
MEQLKDILRFLLGFAAVAGFLWLYWRLNLFFYERGWIFRRSPKVEIQTLFHGNTKDDKDQI